MEHPFGRLVGGKLCLDFVNTVKGRVSSGTGRTSRDYADRVVGERLDSYDALLRWAMLSGALTARQGKALMAEGARRPGEASAVLLRARALREAMYRLFKGAIENWPPPPGDLDILNRELHAARAHERITAAGGFRWTWEERPALDRVLWPLVQSAGELLTGAGLERVGQCPGDECGWLFFDASRSRRRQWCDMAECGNLAKVHRFRARRRASG